MDGIWIIDSGASQHMVSDQNLLQDFHVYEKPHEIKVTGNCDLIYAVGEGNIKKTLARSLTKENKVELIQTHANPQ